MSRLIPLRLQPPRDRLLEEVKQEVVAAIAQSLHAAVLANFSPDSQPLGASRCWDVEVKAGNRPSFRLPPKASISKVFDRSGGKLVILGATGSGKTTTLLELALVLVSRAQKDASLPLPVLFELGSWKVESGAIADWLIAQLQYKYGISPATGKKWLAEQKLLPLLDGLDEVETQRQNLCIQAINQFLESEIKPKHLVACSSFEVYKNCPTRFKLQAAVLLKPLTEIQIKNYLQAARSRELWYSIEKEPELLKLAKVPLLLSMMALAYDDILIEAWKRISSVEEQRKYLLTAYIRHQISREVKQYPRNKELRPEQIRHWLGWLARRMEQQGLQEFYLDRIPSGWLQTGEEQRKYQFGVKLLGGLIWVILGLIFTLVSGSSWGLIAGAVVAVISAFLPGIPGIENFILHLVLWSSGHIPWDYQRFLDAAGDRLLLQKTGDRRYRFIHDLLQKHFAEI
ncbi:NACHT domain-containing protein [Tychonema sp. LEGE 07199]|uniref:NACHT domain-containing protein n=1 Tax=unclassified Tychonema TaxID=2642144 RepID=UPI0018800419|nr:MULTISPECIES: NACHT domain-containing protein [unclassified Tychonema]MBE9121564.1 NACHT domain-containing protein [Tychonema sp. LEGE 07199]MBE9132660.1 NACHT domain-containing protein [Tychonema sp. LEGE 07196]